MDYKIALTDLMKQKSYVDQSRELIMIKNINILCLIYNRGSKPFSGQVPKFEIKLSKMTFYKIKLKKKHTIIY